MGRLTQIAWISTMLALVIGFLSATAAPLQAQVDERLFESMEYRSIGPYRGGRVTTVIGVESDPQTYYMGATGGGVWKTTDAGITWHNVSDDYFNTTGIGSIAVYQKNPNIVYVGTGESPIRGVKTSHGDGVYKSTDAGKTWTHIGLENTRHIGQVFIHPDDPDVVYVAAQGNPWGPGPDRGLYLTRDGGESWEKILYVNEDSGIVELSVSADNPDVMMATSWEFRRRPWQVRSGGPGSRVFKSTDGGANWREITKGLPELKGKMGVSISPADPNVVYLAIEAKDGQGGVYRSEDAGESFKQVSDDARTWARAWYYMHITADPNDVDEVWVMNGQLLKSIDGGKTYSEIPAPHGDHHAIWINPNDSDSNIVINGNDGGANVSMNGGKTWSTQMNQPTGQFYRIITDNQFPYRIYSSQQDSNAITIASESLGQGIDKTHWWSIGSGESATIAFDPEDPEHVYSTYFASNFGEYDRDTRNYRMVRPYPERVTGEQPKNLKLRANWNGPVIVSPHNPDVIYYGSQYLMRSTDRGRSWETLSPDLTRNDKDKQGLGGVPISNEQITAESYNNLFVIAESPLQEGVIWTGSDGGLVHITRDGGESWENVTPRGMDEAIVNVIDASPHDPATAYIAVAGYKMNDFTPHIYKTDDYGDSWENIVDGIPANTFARSVREDPERRGLLYAGTETGVFVSFNDGEDWQSFQLNLPEVPVTDLHVRQNNLNVSTQGRSLWILDDLTPLHQIDREVERARYHLYDPRDPYQKISLGYPDGSSCPHGSCARSAGENPPSGLQVNYVLSEAVAEDVPMSVEILDSTGRTIHSQSAGEAAACEIEYRPSRKPLSREAGGHRWSWNMHIGRFPCFPEIALATGNLDGYKAIPGSYAVRLTIGDWSETHEFEILADPRLDGTDAEIAREYADMHGLFTGLFDAAMEMSDGVRRLRLAKDQLANIEELSPPDQVREAADELDETIDGWIALILQKELKTFQNVYQHEARMLMKVKDLIGRIGDDDTPVSVGSREVTQAYLDEWADYEARLEAIEAEAIPAFNRVAQAAGLPPVYLPQ